MTWLGAFLAFCVLAGLVAIFRVASSRRRAPTEPTPAQTKIEAEATKQHEQIHTDANEQRAKVEAMTDEELVRFNSADPTL